MIKRIAATAAQITTSWLGILFAMLTTYGYTSGLIYYGKGTGFIPIIITAMLLLLVVIEVISCVSIEDSTIHTVLLSASILASYIFSTDVLNMIELFGANVNVQVCEIFHYLFFLCIVLSDIYFIDFAYKTKINRPFVIYLIMCAAISFVAYIPLSFYNLQFIAYIIFLASFSAALINIYARVFAEGSEDATFYLTLTILFVGIGMQTVDVSYACGGISFKPLGYSSMHIFVIILLFIAVYISFIIRTSREAFKASEYKLQLERLRTRVLREQINPHFMFNSLTAVKSLYHKDLEAGDHAINLFSRHLRANVEAFDKDVVPFEKEIDNIAIFVELQNLKYSSPFKIIYDIAFLDFEVPVLSLQVFVENAIKYSKVNQKPDGYIEISSYEEGENIILEVNDNGEGFDPDSISPASFGIKNARERFELLLGANVEIFSAPKQGTSVKITIEKNY